jgi:zinc transport system substrate-binding protein
VFAEPQFNPKPAEVITRDIGGKVVFIDPLARNYLNNMKTVTRELIQGLR